MAGSGRSLPGRSGIGQSTDAELPGYWPDRPETRDGWNGIEDRPSGLGGSSGIARCETGPDVARTGGGVWQAYWRVGERGDDRTSCKGSVEVLAKKKTVVPTERQRASVVDHRAQFLDDIRKIPAHKLVFIDETGSHIAMTPEYARAPVGRRAIAHVPRNRGVVTTVIGALTERGLTALMAVEGGTSTDVFLDFVCGHLVSTLRPGDVVVMDNLAAHHAKSVRNVIESCGAHILFTPSYSPDLNPIELYWSKFKSLLKGLGARTNQALRAALHVASSLITRSDIRGWFRHCFFLKGQPT